MELKTQDPLLFSFGVVVSMGSRNFEWEKWNNKTDWEFKKRF